MEESGFFSFPEKELSGKRDPVKSIFETPRCVSVCSWWKSLPKTKIKRVEFYFFAL